MQYSELNVDDCVEIRVPIDEAYRTCAECGGDCYPDTSAGADGMGLHSVVDPFEDKR